MITIEIKRANKTGNDLSLYISFPYDQNVINIMRELPCRYWHNDLKAWETPFKQLGHLLTQLSKYEIEIKSDDAAIFQSKKENPVDYKFKTKPFQHQVDGFNYGLTHDRWLLGDSQGLGKSKQVIDIAIAKKQQRDYKHCLIVCGVNGLKWNWVEEIKTHSDEKSWIIGQTTKNGKTIIGSNAEKVKQLQSLLNGEESELNDAYFLITNVESLRTNEIADTLAELCRIGKIGLVAADEVHKMKNPMSQQGKGFLKIQADTMIAMTGTPLMNTPLDLYIILKWLGYEDHSYYAFKNHYCVMGGYGNYQIVGYKHLDSLQEQLNGIMLRRLKEEVLDLPEKTYIDEFVEMTDKQMKIYKEIHSDLVDNIDMVKKAVNPLSEMIRLRQATGYTGILSSTIQESAKLDRMEEIVDDAVANNQKVVIFSNWTQMTDVVLQRLEKYNPALLTGQLNDAEKNFARDKFRHDDTCKVIIGTIGAMGTGYTLVEGTVEIFLDHPWNRAIYDQAVDRCHRIGQKQNITVYNLLCKNTIDERIWEIVQKKGAISDQVVDGEVVGDKGTIVDYLLS